MAFYFNEIQILSCEQSKYVIIEYKTLNCDEKSIETRHEQYVGSLC